MGIPKLKKFIEEHRLFVEVLLYHTKIVVDGLNVLSSVMGRRSDLQQAYARVTNFVAKLRAVNIEPYFIFDGSDEPDDRKLRTLLQRMNRDILLYEQKRDIRTTLLLFDTGRRALKDAGVLYVKCPFEADVEIKDLANKLRCPVMSDDGDFYLMPVTAGFVPFCFVEESLRGKSPAQLGQEGGLLTNVYYFTNFLREFHIRDANAVALLPTLCGGDYSDQDLYKAFLTYLRSVAPRRIPDVNLVADWLGNLACLDEGVEKIAASFNEEKRKDAQKTIRRSVDAFLGVKTSHVVDLYEYFITATPDSPHKFPQQYDVSSPDENGAPIPDENGFCVVAKERYHCQLEDLDKDAVFKISSDLRAVKYSIRLNHRPEKQQASEGPENKYVVLEFRKRKRGDKVTEQELNFDIPGYREVAERVQVVPVELCFSIKGFGTVPTTKEISSMSSERKVSFLYRLFEVPEDSMRGIKKKWEESRLVIASIAFWKHRLNEDSISQKNRVSSLLLGHLLLTENAARTLHYKSRAELRRLSSTDISLRSDEFIQTIHYFMEFATCLQQAMGINSSLDNPLPNPNPANVMNKVFLYSVYKELQDGQNSVERILDHRSPLMSVFRLFERIAHADYK